MKTIIEKAGKSKSNILEKIGKWGWASIISNLLTLATLWYTIYDNGQKENDDKAKENKNEIELNRIRKRDSTQIAILTQSYNSQNFDMQRNRKNDSVQLKQYNYQLGLLNKSLKAQTRELEIQNESLVLQKRSSQSNLLVNTSFEPYRLPVGSYDSYISSQPTIQVKNNGGTMAYDMEVRVLNLIIDTWEKKVISCAPIYFGDTYNLNIESSKSENLKNVPNLYLRTDYDSEKIKYRNNLLEKRGQELAYNMQILRNKKDKNFKIKESELSKNYYAYHTDLFKRYSPDIYKNYLITEIKYRDKYEQKKKIYYSIDQVVDIWPVLRSRPNSINPTHMDIQIRCISASIDDIFISKDCMIQLKLDYETILSKVSNYK